MGRWKWEGYATATVWDACYCYNGNQYKEACPFNLPGFTVEKAKAIVSRDMPMEPVSLVRRVSNMFHLQSVGVFGAYASIRNRIFGPRKGQVRLSSIRTLARQVLVQEIEGILLRGRLRSGGKRWMVGLFYLLLEDIVFGSCESACDESECGTWTGAGIRCVFRFHWILYLF